MEVKKELLGCDRITMAESGQTLRLIMPLADVQANILCGNANAYVTSCTVQGGEARADGMLRGSITFEGEEFDTVYSQQEFTASVPVSAEASAAAYARVVNCSCRREGSSAVLEVEIKVCFICSAASEQTVITEIDGDCERLTTQQEYTSLAGIYNQRSALHENIELNVRMPQIKRCLQASPGVVVSQTRVENGSVMLSGDIALSVLYSCGDDYEPVTQVADRIPFSAVIDAPGALEGDEAFALVAVEDGTVLPQDNEQGEKRILACDIGINCMACVMRRKTADIVINAYSTRNDAERVFEDAALCRTECCSGQQSVRVVLDKPQEAPPMARICAVNAFPQVVRAQLCDGTAMLDCRACFQVIYIVSGTGETASFSTAEEFTINADCGFAPDAAVSACISTDMLQAALLSGNKCELRMVFNADMIGQSKNSIHALADITQGEPRKDGCGICIYISQKGDSLFTVGEQLGVSLQELTALNPELEKSDAGGIEPGTRITVFRRLHVS